MTPPIYLENGCADSDCPRDFFRYLAEFTGGFVYVEPESGYLALGQFGMVSPGKAEIFMNEVEADNVFRVQITSEDTSGMDGIYKIHFCLTDTNDLKYRKLAGTLNVKPAAQG